MHIFRHIKMEYILNACNMRKIFYNNLIIIMSKFENTFENINLSV